MKDDFTALKNFINQFDRFFLCGHIEPDGDCIGSQLALASLLRRLGKTVYNYSPGPFNRKEVEEFVSLMNMDLPEKDQVEAALLVDIASPDRTGDAEELVRSLPVGIIDHHRRVDPFGDAVYIDSSIPAATLLVQKLIESYGMEVTPDEAEWIFFGFSTDTGFFRHLENYTGETFLHIARLVDRGVSPKSMHKRLSATHSFGTRKLMGRILDRLECLLEGRFLLSWETPQDRIDLKTDDRDSSTLYQLMLSTEGCEAAAILREKEEGKCVVGLRSNGRINVSEIAQAMGGGGHFCASGFSSEKNLAEIKTDLIALFSKQID